MPVTSTRLELVMVKPVRNPGQRRRVQEDLSTLRDFPRENPRRNMDAWIDWMTSLDAAVHGSTFGEDVPKSTTR